MAPPATGLFVTDSEEEDEITEQIAKGGVGTPGDVEFEPILLSLTLHITIEMLTECRQRFWEGVKVAMHVGTKTSKTDAIALVNFFFVDVFGAAAAGRLKSVAELMGPVSKGGQGLIGSWAYALAQDAEDMDSFTADRPPRL
jgi:hypothetical protein